MDLRVRGPLRYLDLTRLYFRQVARESSNCRLRCRAIRGFKSRVAQNLKTCVTISEMLHGGDVLDDVVGYVGASSPTKTTKIGEIPVYHNSLRKVFKRLPVTLSVVRYLSKL